MTSYYHLTRWPRIIPELFTFKLFEQFPEVYHGISTRQSEKTQPNAIGLNQVHGTKFVRLSEVIGQPQPAAADAIIVDQPNATIRIGTSDCVPMIIYEPPRRQGAVLHAGLRGTSQEILTRLLQEFTPQRCWLGIGPAIGPECYNKIDLQLENLLQAQQAGVPLNQIEIMPWCTKCNNGVFYSYRAGDRQNFGTYLRLNL